MKTPAQQIPIACNMDVFTPAERENHILTTTRLFQSVQTIHEAENMIQLAEFIFNERRCCPFLEFTLKIAHNDAPISLLLTGPEGTQEFLRTEFGEAFNLYENKS